MVSVDTTIVTGLADDGGASDADDAVSAAPGVEPPPGLPDLPLVALELPDVVITPARCAEGTRLSGVVWAEGPARCLRSPECCPWPRVPSATEKAGTVPSPSGVRASMTDVLDGSRAAR